MPASAPVPLVDVAVVFVVDSTGTRLLFDYNEKWRVFTLPMTKVEEPAGAAEAAHAALRAAVEVLGVPLAKGARPKRFSVEVLGALPEAGAPIPRSTTTSVLQEGMRDGEVKQYKYFPHALRAKADPRPLPGHVAVWLTPDEAFDCEPVSPSVRELLGAIPFADIVAAAP